MYNMWNLYCNLCNGIQYPAYVGNIRVLFRGQSPTRPAMQMRRFELTPVHFHVCPRVLQ